MNTEQMRALAERPYLTNRTPEGAVFDLTAALREAAGRIDALEGALRDDAVMLNAFDVKAYMADAGYLDSPWRAEVLARQQAIHDLLISGGAVGVQVLPVASDSLNTGEPTAAVPGVANEGDA